MMQIPTAFRFQVIEAFTRVSYLRSHGIYSRLYFKILCSQMVRSVRILYFDIQK